MTRDDLRVVAPALFSLRELALAPVSPATLRAFSQAVIGWIWLICVGAAAMVYVSVSVFTSPLGIGLVLALGGVWVAHWFAVAEAARLTAQTGVDVVAAPRRPNPRGGFWRTALSPLADGRSWAAIGYAAVSMVTSTIAFTLVIGFSAMGLAGLGAPLYLEHRNVPVHTMADVMSNVGPLPVAVLGLLLVWLTPVVAQASALAQVTLGRALLSQSAAERARAAQKAAEAARWQAETARREAEARARHMVHRAEHLTQTRTEAVSAADDDRRRIERDLHDGAQQRLVALGVELGVARRQAATDPQSAVAALDHAHAEVKETLAELRDLVRGIHPAVLADRGLDAALSALAARTPVPVEVVVGDPQALAACGPSAQAAAYFVVAEALTNTAKHAHASSATVEVTCERRFGWDTPARGLLRVVVTDDGVGGADASSGTGLDGLRARVAALDGTFDLVSPPDGGTRLTVEVPCVS